MGASRNAWSSRIALSIAVVAASVLTGTPARAVGQDILVTARPGSGPVRSTFQATVDFGPAPCSPGKVGFYQQPRMVWGTTLGPLMNMPSDCKVTESLTAPASWSTGNTYHFFAVYQATDRHAIGYGMYTITSGTPTPSASAKAHPSATAVHPSSPAPDVVAATTPTGDPTTTTPSPVPSEPVPAILTEASSAGGLPWSWIGLGASALVVAVGTVLLRRRRTD
jgi:hypothetical protein